MDKKPINSYEQVLGELARIRGKHKGFVSNFFPDRFRTEIWIQNGWLFYIARENSVAFLKDNGDFSSLFYIATCLDEVSFLIQSLHEKCLIVDILGVQIDNEENLFHKNGFTNLAQLHRMNLVMEPGTILNHLTDEHIHYAVASDIPSLYLLLNNNFDTKTEQLPTQEELNRWIDRKEILLHRIDGEIAGFLIFDMALAVMTIRYWFVSSFHRGKGVGSALIREGLFLARHTRCIRLWVIDTNEKARTRYQHYGFIEDTMKDIIMMKRY